MAPTTIGSPAPVLVFDALDSTNAEARRRALAGETGPLWIAARRQTQGQGRRGRAWSTELGNLAATFLTRSEQSQAEAAGVSFVAALAVADLAGAFVSDALVACKWPNDVLVAGRKLSGVLVEQGALAGGGLWLAVGIGVNLAHAPHDLERPATALAEHLRAGVAAAPAPEEALSLLASRFAHWQAVWEREGLGAVLADWRARAVGLSGPILVRLTGETLEGTAQGLDADGALRLATSDGQLRRITAGDVFLAAAAAGPLSQAAPDSSPAPQGSRNTLLPCEAGEGDPAQQGGGGPRALRNGDKLVSQSAPSSSLSQAASDSSPAPQGSRT